MFFIFGLGFGLLAAAHAARVSKDHRRYTATPYGPREQGLRVPVQVYGDKSELVPLPGGRLKTRILRILPDGVARLFLHRLRQGSFLVSRLSR